MESNWLLTSLVVETQSDKSRAIDHHIKHSVLDAVNHETALWMHWASDEYMHHSFPKHEMCAVKEMLVTKCDGIPIYIQTTHRFALAIFDIAITRIHLYYPPFIIGRYTPTPGLCSACNSQS